MGFFDFLRGAGKQVELKPEVLKAEIAEITDNPNYEVTVDEATLTSGAWLGPRMSAKR